MATESIFQAKFGDKSYILSITMFNSEGDSIALTRGALKYLELEDNLLNTFHTGTLVIANDFNVVESGIMPYSFLGNGRDYLSLTIQTENTNEDFTLSFLMVVTECVDVKYQYSVCKQLKFCEERQYILNEKFCDILEIKKNTTGASSYLDTNAGSAQTTGELIRSILKAAFEDADGAISEVFDEEDCLSLNLSPYGIMPYAQILNYVMQSHSHKKSPCVLMHDRQKKTFQVKSFSKLFDDHASNVVETLIFPDVRNNTASNEKTQPNIKYTPTDKVFGTNDAGGDSTIIQFSAEAPTALHGVNFFASQATTGFSRNYSTFSYNLKTLNRQEYTQTYNDLFVLPFSKMFKDYSLLPNFYVAKIKQQKNWTQVDGALPAAITEQQFLNQKLLSLLFLNQTYTFKLPGITMRRSGTFIDVYKHDLTGPEPSNWDYNTIGRHLITCVKHIFTHDAYTNHVETIKPYRIYNKHEHAQTLEQMLSNSEPQTA